MSLDVPIITTTLGASPELATRIAKGFKDGVLRREGGVIRNIDNGQFVGFLRDVPGTQSTVNSLAPLLQLNAAASALNLSITAVGFVVLMKRLDAIEQKLVAVSQVLQGLNRKLDLSFLANFRAALELARSAFAMAEEANRRASAYQAINRFLEAEHHYLGLLDMELADGGWAVSPYFNTLMLAYVSSARCYLELGETETAQRHLVDGENALAPRLNRYYQIVVGVNPAIYLHPGLSDQITLERLTRLKRHHQPRITGVECFEELRQQIWDTAVQDPDSWIMKLPTALWNHAVDGEKKIGPMRRRISSNEMVKKLLSRLPEAFDQVEQAHESLDSVRGFEAELGYVLENKIRYTDWSRLEMPPAGASDSIVLLLPEKSELLSSLNSKQVSMSVISE